MPLPLAFVLLTLALLLPAFVNGGAFVFPDTTAYVRGADAAVVKATGRRSAWSDRLFDRYPQAAAPMAPSASVAPPSAPREAPIVLSGRSIYYGALLYAASLGGNLWPIAILQAALAAIVLLLTLRRFGDGSGVGGVGALVLVVLLTSVGYFAAFAMPDVFAPLAILAGGHIAFAWALMGSRERFFWLGLMTAGMAFHTATLIIMLGLGTISLIVRGTNVAAGRDGRSWPFLLGIALAIGAELLFSTAIRRATGSPPVRPPFLMARLIEDGPGLHYLKAHCRDSRAFAICRHVDRLPLPSDTLLWSTDPRDGLFKLVPPSEQRLLAAEEMRFTLAVLVTDPVGVTISAGRNAVAQAVAVGLPDFDPSADTVAKLDEAIPEPIRAGLAGTRALRERMPTEPAATLGLPLAALSLLAIGYAMARPGGDGRMRCPSLALAAWIVAGVILNAIACGVLSGPHDRYGARVVWLLPVAALVALGRRRSDEKTAPIRRA